jgi:hypothetical protein
MPTAHSTSTYTTQEEMSKPGLYSNIRKRRAAGKKPRKPGTKGRPSDQDFKNAAKTAKKSRLKM